jgi:hypothetical protein
MHKIAIAIVFALLSTPCHAQIAPTTGQCDQVRAAIAQHGLAAARKHAMEHHGLTRADLRTIEQSCSIGDRGPRAKR